MTAPENANELGPARRPARISSPAANSIGAGLAAALVLTRVLRSYLFGLGNSTAATVGLALALITITAFIACAAPARRATRIDPMNALRHE